MIDRRSRIVVDWSADEELLRRWRYGVIETHAGEFASIHLRWTPKLLAWPEIWPVGRCYHARGLPDRCLLYYNQPWRFPNFLAVKYVVSTAGTLYRTLRAALTTLDRLADLKQTDALLCDVANSRISDRCLARQGWASHKPQRFHRNYIKRFYGAYPPNALADARVDCYGSP